MRSLYIVFVTIFIFNNLFAQIDTSLVLLSNIDSTFTFDVKYSTPNNFTGKTLYKTDKVFLRKIAADSLSKVNKYFKTKFNYSLKIFDGYRPLSVQKFMWSILPDDRYVANPQKGSRHNRGAAVDLTLLDSLGNELDMGTEYDNFTIKAHPEYQYLPDNVKHNRKILSDGMQKFGFIPINSEWWHFDFKGWKNFSILDIEIE